MQVEERAMCWKFHARISSFQLTARISASKRKTRTLRPRTSDDTFSLAKG